MRPFDLITSGHALVTTCLVLFTSLPQLALAGEPGWATNWWWTSGPADWILVLVGIGTAIAALRTLRSLERQVKANEDAAIAAKDAAEATADNAASARLNAQAAVDGAVAAAKNTEAAIQSAQAAQRAAEIAEKSLYSVQRAYLWIEPLSPGFIIPVDDAIKQKEERDVSFVLRIINRGSTPAVVEVANFYLVITDEPLLEDPEYTDDHRVDFGGFLVPGHHFQLFRNVIVSAETLSLVGGDSPFVLYLLGYVDYVDAFGRRHRSGFARRYNPSIDVYQNHASHADYLQRMNLNLVQKPGYNYDRDVE